MVGKVRKPIDEYQMAQRRSKALQEHTSADRMPSIYSTAPATMPVGAQAGSTTGKPVKMKSDNPAIKKKIKGVSSEIM
jgi:hypothetical protein